jgi:hypothetical protein
MTGARGIAAASAGIQYAEDPGRVPTKGEVRMKTKLFSLLLSLACLAPGAGMAAGDPAAEAYPVALKVGETFMVCASGEVICPVSGTICDDGKVIRVVDTPEGAGFKGIAPGETLCSVASGGGRRLFRLTVR